MVYLSIVLDSVHSLAAAKDAPPCSCVANQQYPL